MRNKPLYIILFSLLLAFLFLPMVQEHYSLFKVKPLKGHTKPIDFPELSYKSYSQGKFQGKLEQYVSENFGFRETVIRLYNQYVWTCFNKTYVHFITPGKNNWIYYTGAVKDYYGTEQHSIYKSTESAKKNYDNNIRMMCQLRNILKTYDIEFLSFMAPSKVRVYPEYLPDMKRDTNTINPVDYYSEKFAETGFPNIEMTSWFISMKDTLGYQVFSTMDNHWQFTSIYAYDSLFRFMDSLKDSGFPKIKYGEPYPHHVKYQDDEASLNLLFPVRNKNTEYKMDVTVECDSNDIKPKVLFVGDSFIWGLTKFLPYEKILGDIEIWFYNKDVYKGFSKTPYKKEDVNILESILNTDYIVFYTTGHQWYRSTYGFVEDALLALCVSDSLMEAESIRIADSLNISIKKAQEKIKKEPYIIRGIMDVDNPSIRNEKDILIANTINKIREDKNWIEALMIQSSIQGKNINEILAIEANNILNNDTLLRDMTSISEEQIFEAKVNELVRQWRLNNSMIQYLKNKAKDKGKDFETVIYEDARWVIRQEQNKQK